MARKLLSYFMVILAFVLTAAFYLCFDLEGILWDSQEQTEISAEQIKKHPKKNYTGRKAGKGILKVKTLKQWNQLKKGVRYVTVTPKGIETTGVYGLAAWSKNSEEKGKRTKKMQEAIRPKFDYTGEYTPFYILTLEDGNKILAQITRSMAGKVKRGKEVSLPIGRKVSVTNKARELLKEQGEKEHVSLDTALYAIDNHWEKKNADAVFYGKIGITIFAFILIAILLQVLERAIAKAVFKKDRRAELKDSVESLSEEERTADEVSDDEEGELF